MIYSTCQLSWRGMTVQGGCTVWSWLRRVDFETQTFLAVVLKKGWGGGEGGGRWNRKVMSLKTYIFSQLSNAVKFNSKQHHAGWPVARYCYSLLIKPLACPAGCRKVDDNAKLFRGGLESETTACDAGYHCWAPGEGHASCDCCWFGRTALTWPPAQSARVTNP